MKTFRYVFILSLVLFISFPVFANSNKINNEIKNENFIENLINSKNFDMSKTIISHDSNPKPIKIPKGKENYINPITGEYFIIQKPSNKSSVAREFSFNIRIRLEGPEFNINSERLSVYAQSSFYDNRGNISSPNFGSTYSIKLAQGWFGSKVVSYPINGSQTSTFGSGWKTSKPVHLEIGNDGSFDRYDGYLEGSGTVYND